MSQIEVIRTDPNLTDLAGYKSQYLSGQNPSEVQVNKMYLIGHVPGNEALVFFGKFTDYELSSDLDEQQYPTIPPTAYDINEIPFAALKRVVINHMVAASYLKDWLFAEGDISLDLKVDQELAIPPSVFVGNFDAYYVAIINKAKYFDSDSRNADMPDAAIAQAVPPTNTADPSANNSMQYPSGIHITELKLADIDFYITMLEKIFNDLKAKIDQYSMEFTRPFDPERYIDQLKNLKNELKRVTQEGTPIDSTAPPFNNYDPKKVRIHFNDDFLKAEKIDVRMENANPSMAPWYGLKITSSYFQDQTINFLIYNLPKIINQYQTKIAALGADSGVFTNDDEVRSFLNSYIKPSPDMNFETVGGGTGTIVQDGMVGAIAPELIERFILGDINILNDEYYNAYRVAPDDIPITLKHQLALQINEQYEKIGDFMGQEWQAGKFRDIRNADDLYKDVLNSIDVDQIIEIAAGCLLQLIPLDEWLDTICEDVLANYEAHQVAIIGWLEDMDDSTPIGRIGKNLASELTEVYFESLTKFEDYMQDAMANSADLIAGWVVDWISAGTFWSNAGRIDHALKNQRGQAYKLEKILGEDVNGNTVPGMTLSEIENSIVAKLINLERQAAVTSGGQEQLGQKQEVFDNFNTDAPETFTQTSEAYAAENTYQEQRRNDILANKYNIEDQLRMYDALNTVIIPNLRRLNPYHGDYHQWFALVDNANNNLSAINPTQGHIDALTSWDVGAFKSLLSVEYPELLNAAGGTIQQFAFPGDYLHTKAEVKAAYDEQIPFGDNDTLEEFYEDHRENLENAFEQNVKIIQNILEKGIAVAVAANSTLPSLSALGGKTIDAFAKSIFSGEDGKGRALCLAIFGTVPAAIYAIIMFTKNPGGVGDFFKNQGEMIYKGLKRRLDMFLRTDYPIVDILKAFKDSLVTTGLNLARDLIMNVIAALLENLRKACADDETNAAYDPYGAIDLSDFIIQTQKAKGKQEDPSFEDDPGYQDFNKKSGLTIEQYEELLGLLSSTFSITEMCKLLGRAKAAAPESLYQKAIAVLKTLPWLAGTDFESMYVNDIGIVTFFKIVSSTIDPQLCNKAVENFEKQKKILFNLCAGTLDNETENKLAALNFDASAIKDLLANNAQFPKIVMKDTLKVVNKVLGPTAAEDIVCKYGDTEGKVNLFDPSQRHTTALVGNSIFKSLETHFETDIGKIKPLYKGMWDSMNSELMSTDAFGKDLTEEEKSEMVNDFKAASMRKQIVAGKIFDHIRNEIFDDDHERKIKRIGATDIKLELKYPDPVFRGIEFEYKASPANAADTTIQYYDTNEPLSPFAIATYDKFKKYKAWGTDATKELEDWFDILLTTGTDNLGSANAQQIIAAARPPSEGGHDFYMKLINSIYDDMLLFSLQSKLFNKEAFNQIYLNKISNFDGDCFLGYLNSQQLTDRLTKLASFFSCFAGDMPPEETPTNIAMIKLTLECLIRIIVVQEVMKSLFVYGMIPTELARDEQQSLYDQVINSEVARSISQYFSSQDLSDIQKANGLGKFDDINFRTWYDEVIVGFITNINKKILQDESVTDKQAYDRLKNTEIEYVKQTTHLALSKSLGSYYTQPTTYQVLEKAYNSLEYENQFLNLETIGIADKVKILQSDNLSSFLHGRPPVIGSHTGSVDPITWAKPNSMHGGYARATTNYKISPGTIGYKYPVLDRETFDTVKFWNAGVDPSAEVLGYEFSADLGEILGQNTSGLALEKMIEVKPNAQFYTSLTTEQKTNLDHFFRILFDGSLLNPEHEVEVQTGTDDEGAPVFALKTIYDTDLSKIYRHRLRNFLYESKLIMLFPQAMSIVDSLAEDSPDALWQKWSKKNFNKGIFSALFEFNFNPEFDKSTLFDLTALTDKESDPDLDYITTGFGNSAPWLEAIINDLDWTNYGKIYPENFEVLINRFLYPFQAINKAIDFDPLIDGQPNMPYKINKPTALQYAADDEYISTIVPKSSGDNDFEAGSTNVSYNYTHTGLFLRHIVHHGISGTGVLDNLGAFFPSALFKPTIKGFSSENNIWGPSNFLGWLYGQPIENIMSINTIFRLNTYISAPLHDQTSPLQKKIMQHDGADLPKLLAEKSGAVNFKGHSLTEKMVYGPVLQPDGESQLVAQGIKITDEPNKVQYISFPMCTATRQIPSNLTWFRFFMKIDPESYLKPEFYERFIGPENFDIQSINEALFVSDIPPNNEYKTAASNDVLSYFRRLQHITSLGGTDVKKTIMTRKYKSTNWFNVRGYVFSQQDILQHFESGEDVLRSCVSNDWDLNFAVANWNQDPMGRMQYLTRASLASLNESQEMYASLDGKIYAANLIDNWSGNFPQRQYPGTKKPHVTGNEDSKCIVGQYELTHEDGTTRMVDKFIQIKAYSYSKNAWIDFGFPAPPHGFENKHFVADAAAITEMYPGSFFEPDVIWHEPSVTEGVFNHPLKYPLQWKYPTAMQNNGLGSTFTNILYSGGDPPSKGGGGKVTLGIGWETHGLSRYLDYEPPLDYEDEGMNNLGEDAQQEHFVHGGLISADRVEEAVDLSGVTLFNMYNCFERMLGEDSAALWQFNLLLDCFFTKELTTVIALQHKLITEKVYPEINSVFEPSKMAATAALFTAVAVANGDYKHKTEDFNPFDGLGSINLSDIANQILQAFMGAMANTVDPTWKTEWFLPGPLTPIGVVAKLIADEDLFKGSPGTRKGSVNIDFCSDDLMNQLQDLEAVYTSDALKPPPKDDGDE